MKRRILKVWYDELMHRLPVRVFIQRLEVLGRIVSLRQGLQAIAMTAAFRS